MKVLARLFLQFAVTAMLLTSNAVVLGDDFPGNKPNKRIIKSQEKVDALFEKGDYERAAFIYREELAPLGDKYAQYMIGYMYLTGKGVTGDMAVASAWYRLAAERGDDHFLKARDEIWGTLNEQQRTQSDSTYTELRKDYGDAMLVADFVERDIEILYDEVMVYSSARAADREYNPAQRKVSKYEELIQAIEYRLNFLAEMQASGRMYGDDEIIRYEQLFYRADFLIKAYKAEN
jgi:hypothetical protein